MAETSSFLDTVSIYQGFNSFIFAVAISKRHAKNPSFHGPPAINKIFQLGGKFSSNNFNSITETAGTNL